MIVLMMILIRQNPIINLRIPIQITCLKQEVSFEILILNATFARNFFIHFIQNFFLIPYCGLK